ncbi:MAG TPA: hypothetical protein DCX54_07355, partial [Flavobacteriales bacterium]|nr:hypothetical protein [Flavobacteriales bacterium]
MHRFLLVAISVLFISKGFSQGVWCAFDSENEAKFNQLSIQDQIKAEKDRKRIFSNAQIQHSKSGPIYTIPTVIHVIHDDCDGNISMEQIREGMRILNEDFRRQNSDTINTRPIFQGVAADAEIQFVLANLDPNGNCTEGVVRVNSPLTNSASPRDAVKSVSYWNSSKYFNIWLVNSIESSGSVGTILGYAQFPYFGSSSTYGLVCRHDEWSNIGTATGASARGRVPSHEVGHCLGLYRTFQGSCGSNCNNSGDEICD